MRNASGYIRVIECKVKCARNRNTKESILSSCRFYLIDLLCISTDNQNENHRYDKHLHYVIRE
jgi:hypothetical protein